jgi:hypothetical protein
MLQPWDTHLLPSLPLLHQNEHGVDAAPVGGCHVAVNVRCHDVDAVELVSGVDEQAAAGSDPQLIHLI